VWQQIAAVAKCDGAARAAIARLAEWIARVDASPAVECWEGACCAKRVARVLAGLEKFARAERWDPLAEQFAAGRAAIVRAQGFALFFE
jgi:hypothetical protein